MSSNYYETLGVSQTATLEEIKKSYKRLAMKYHPDRGTADSDEAKFKEISEAYETLHKPEKRAEYDQLLKYGATGDPFANSNYTQPNWSNFSDDIFRFFHGAARQPQQPQRNTSFMSDLQITLEEAYTGVQKEVLLANNTYERKTINIPPGISTGDRLKLHGCGSSKIEGLPPGDHIINMVVVQHHRFKRKGADLYVTVTIGAFEAMFGLQVEMTHLDKQKVMFKIPPGTQSNQSIRLRGKGMPVVNTNNRGDLYIIVKVLIPKLDGDSEEDIAQMAKVRNDEISI